MACDLLPLYSILKGGAIVNMDNQNLGFYFALSQFTASTINSISPMLDSFFEKIPRHTLVNAFLFSYAIAFIAWLFWRQDKGQAPYNLWGLSIPRWVISSFICICFSALLLLQTFWVSDLLIVFLIKLSDNPIDLWLRLSRGEASIFNW